MTLLTQIGAGTVEKDEGDEGDEGDTAVGALDAMYAELTIRDERDVAKVRVRVFAAVTSLRSMPEGLRLHDCTGVGYCGCETRIVPEVLIVE